MKTISVTIGMSLIACGFLTFAWMLDIIASLIAPTLDNFAQAEVERNCDLAGRTSNWDYEGGFSDCIDWYTAGIRLLFIKLIGVVVGALATFKFLAGGFCLLYYADRPEKETA